MSKHLTDQANQEQLIELADEVFELTTMVSALRSRMRTEDDREPTEIEFLALDILAKAGSQNVGEIQREIGILPAQMSRLIRSLEAKGGLVECKINENDRRKIDVSLTKSGKKAHAQYQATRRATTLEFLAHLDPDDREVFMRVIRSFRNKVHNLLQGK